MKNEENLNYDTDNVAGLFMKLFIPTLLGLVSSSILEMADGIFVGKGVGSDALASVNVAAPVFLLSAGIALLFATGVSIVAAELLSQHKKKAASLCVTQSFGAAAAILALLSLVVFFFPSELCWLFGGTDELEPLVVTYLRGISPVPLLSAVMLVGLFVIRLDGSPKYAMMCYLLSSLLNIFLDWLFVFPMQMGIFGAAIATSISMAVASIGIIIYMFFLSHNVKIYRLTFTAPRLRFAARNVKRVAKLGLPTFIGETALVFMLVAGNFRFVDYLEEEGVAAYGVACYLCPFVLMFGGAIAQSSLPIVSYNYGQRNLERINKVFRLTVVLALALAVAITAAFAIETDTLMSLFLDTDTEAYRLGCQGFPLFTISFLFLTLNVVFIGLYQSIERTRHAAVWMMLRGVVFVIPCFVFLPMLIGVKGLWLAIPLSEALTFATIVGTMIYDKKKGDKISLN